MLLTLENHECLIHLIPIYSYFRFKWSQISFEDIFLSVYFSFFPLFKLSLPNFFTRLHNLVEWMCKNANRRWNPDGIQSGSIECIFCRYPDLQQEVKGTTSMAPVASARGTLSGCHSVLLSRAEQWCSRWCICDQY